MFNLFCLKRFKFFRKTINFIVGVVFIFTLAVPASIAQLLPNLPHPGQMIWFTAEFAPPVLKGMTVHVENPLLFDFIVDRGQEFLSESAIKDESTRLIKYFFAAMTIPDKDAWVNLSPYEKDRIIPDALGQTEMGRQMLEQDYILKQLSSSLTNPEKELGQKFWHEVEKRAYERFGNTAEIPVSTFNKVWIVPNGADIFEKDGFAYITGSKLKVMLEEDYIAMQKNMHSGSSVASASSDMNRSQLNALSSEVFRELILPQLEKELNEGKNFAPIRQVYQSVILATWYKRTLKDSLLGRVYVDKSKIAGIEAQDKDIKQKVYDQYLDAFKKGVYNVVREDESLAGDDVIPRKYFSGGAEFGNKVKISSAPVTDVQRDVEQNGLRLRRVASTGEEPSAASIAAKAVTSSSAVQNAVVEFINGQADMSALSSDSRKELERLIGKILDVALGEEGKVPVQTGRSKVGNDPFADGTRYIGRGDVISYLEDASENLLGLIGLTKGFDGTAGKKVLIITDVENWTRLTNFIIGVFSDILADSIIKIRKINENSEEGKAVRPLLKTIISEMLNGQNQITEPGDVIVQGNVISNVQIISSRIIETALKNISPGAFEKLGIYSRKSKGSDTRVFVAGNFLGEGYGLLTLIGEEITKVKKQYVDKLTSAPEQIKTLFDKIFPLEYPFNQEREDVKRVFELVVGKIVGNDGSYYLDQIAVSDMLNKPDRTTLTVQRVIQIMVEDLGFIKEITNGGGYILGRNRPLGKGHQYTTLLMAEIDDLVAKSRRTESASSPSNKENQPVGGINFDPTLLDLQIKRDGRGVPLPLPLQDVEHINIKGLCPVIINVQPFSMTAIPALSQAVPVVRATVSQN